MIAEYAPSVNLSLFLISKNIFADLKGSNKTVICTMDDMEDFLQAPHGTTLAALISNRNYTLVPLTPGVTRYREL